MAKRMEDTAKYRKSFIRGLPGPYKLLWDYLCCECDHAGIWDVDFQIAQICIGNDMPIIQSEAIEYFNSDEERIVEIDGGKKWFIKAFIQFQYGELNPENRVHQSVINRLNSFNLLGDNTSLEKIQNKGLVRPLQGTKNKNKDKNKNIDIAKNKNKENDVFVLQFDQARKLYPATKLGLQTEFANFKKKHKDWKEVLPILETAIKNQIEHRALLKEAKVDFIPQWKNFQTWINQRCWEMELSIVDTARASPVNQTDAKMSAAINEALARRF